MTIKYTPNYLNELIKLRTPERTEENETVYDTLSITYAHVRSTAELLLKYPGSEDIEKRLEKLLLEKVDLEEKVSK